MIVLVLAPYLINPLPPKGWPITTTSGLAEIALAKHLTKIGAKEYGAFWCPHCYEGVADAAKFRGDHFALPFNLV